MRLFLSALVFFSTAAGAQAQAEPLVSVPLVGCPSDGQLGPVPAPRRAVKRVALPSNFADKLAYYRPKNGPGVLAPRGWSCFSTYGSSGDTTYVSPTLISRRLLFSTDWKGFTGPVIQMSYEYGGTSGRFGVAAAIARVFPKYRDFVTAVQSEGLDPSTTHFPTGPYKTDLLHYLKPSVVEYTTPANAKGLGTDSRLLLSSQPIAGVLLLTGADTDMVSLAVRLPPETSLFAPTIIQQVEREYTDPPPNASNP